MIQKLKNKFLDLIFPPRCAVCGSLGSFVCNECDEIIIKIKSQACPLCHQDNGTGAICSRCYPKTKLSGVLSYGYFKEPALKKVLKKYKYEGLSALSDILAIKLCSVVQDYDLEFDIIAFAPASRKHYNERGYNQAELLAKKMAAALRKPVFNNLTKSKATKSQVGLKRKERLINIAGAIDVKKGNTVVGKRILVIDDVITTGATLNECAKVLRKAGARSVWGVVLARE